MYCVSHPFTPKSSAKNILQKNKNIGVLCWGKWAKCIPSKIFFRFISCSHMITTHGSRSHHLYRINKENSKKQKKNFYPNKKYCIQKCCVFNHIFIVVFLHIMFVVLLCFLLIRRWNHFVLLLLLLNVCNTA